MKHVIVAIHDHAASAFEPPMVFPARGIALRAFSDVVNKAGTTYNVHPDDFAMWQIGTFEDDAGRLLPETENVFLCNARDFLEGNVTALKKEK